MKLETCHINTVAWFYGNTLMICIVDW